MATLEHLLCSSIFRFLCLIVVVIFSTEPNSKPTSVFTHMILCFDFVTAAVGVSNWIRDNQIARPVIIVCHAISFVSIRQNLEVILEPANIGLGITSNVTVKRELIRALDILV